MRFITAAVLGALLLGLSACADEAGGAEGLSVVTSAYPLAYVAQRIVGDRVEVVDLVAPGREPHDMELSLKQTAAVADADLVLRVAGLAPAVDQAVAQEADPEADLEALSTLQGAATGGGPRPVRVLEGDPHFWLDPHALAAYADAVTERLVVLDPEHAGGYRRNAARLRKDLVGLDDRMRAGLAACSPGTVVSSHEAYDYLGYRYDLDFASLVGLSPEDEPSPTTVAQLQRLVDDEGVTTVFYEPLAGPGVVETLASDLGLDVVVLDPVEGLTEDTADEDYLSLMAADLDALTTAGGCAGGSR
jgi:zinc transport system substrate-binding protein